jgi:hypothetical protein
MVMVMAVCLKCANVRLEGNCLSLDDILVVCRTYIKTHVSKYDGLSLILPKST